MILQKLNLFSSAPPSDPTSATLITKHASGQPPFLRQGHSSNSVDNVIYIFGGVDVERSATVNTISILNTHGSLQFQTILHPHGTLPPPRHSHSSCVTKDRRLAIFGGELDGDMLDNSLYLFHVDTKTWSLMKFHGNLPPPRKHHCAIIKDSTLCIFGGEGVDGILNDVYMVNLRSPSGI